LLIYYLEILGGIMKLKDIADIRIANTKTLTSDKVENGKYNLYINGSTVLKTDTYDFEGEYITIPTSGALDSNSVHITHGKFSTLKDVCLVKITDKRYDVYMVLLIIKVYLDYIATSRGITVHHLSRKDYDNIEIPEPTDKLKELSHEIYKMEQEKKRYREMIEIKTDLLMAKAYIEITGGNNGK
jgi:restriction endonuclease S subunit